MEIVEEYSFYKRNISQTFFSSHHGSSVLELILVQSLDEQGILNEKNILNLKEEGFIQQIMNHLKLNFYSTSEFLRFLSYLYFKYNQDIYTGPLCQLLDYLAECSLLRTYQSRISQQNNDEMQQKHNASVIKFVSESSYLKQRQSEQPIQSLIQETNTHSSKISIGSQSQQQQPNQEKFYQQQLLQQQQQNQYQQQQQFSQAQILNTPNQNINNVQNKGYFYNMPQSEIVNNPNIQLNIAFQQQQKKQGNDLQINQQSQNMIGSNLISEEQQYFYKLVEDSKNIIDCISEIQQLQQKWKYLVFETDTSIFKGSQFRCKYESKKHNIPPVFSEPKSKKKDAQHDAARKFLPHLKFFLKYQHPFFEDQNDLIEYLAQSNNQDQQNSSLNQNQIEQDLMLINKYQDDIVAVNLLVQQHERNLLQDSLKYDDSQKQGDYFICIVQFKKGEKVIFEKQAYGTSKKFAKQAAFMKIHPLLINFYNPDIQIHQLNQIHNQPVDIKSLPIIQQLQLNKNHYQVNQNEYIDY